MNSDTKFQTLLLDGHVTPTLPVQTVSHDTDRIPVSQLHGCSREDTDAPGVEHMVSVFLKADYSDVLWQELHRSCILFKGSLAASKSTDVAVEQHLERLRSQPWGLFSPCSDTKTQQSPSGASCKLSSLEKRVGQQGKAEREWQE